jgi:chromosome segregation ATPase
VAKQKRSLAKEDGAEDDDAQQKIHEDTLAELADEANAARENIATLQEELRVANGPKKAQEHQIKRKKNEVKQSKNVLAFSMKELQAKRNEIMQKQGSANDEEGQRQAAAKKAEEAMEEARRVVDESKGPIEDSLKRYDEGKSQEIAVQGAVNAVKAQCSAVHRQIQELKSSQGNSLAIFGQTCETMHRAVEQARQAGKFKGKVIGPIGKYMTVVPGKEHLAAVAEKALQVSLDRYIVTNSHDRQVYLQLRDQIRCGFNDSGVYQMVSKFTNEYVHSCKISCDAFNSYSFSCRLRAQGTTLYNLLRGSTWLLPYLHHPTISFSTVLLIMVRVIKKLFPSPLTSVNSSYFWSQMAGLLFAEEM